jgi:hypothetical protein
MDDEAIQALVNRLSRPRASGGDVIERAAILAAGSDSKAVVAWILAHGGEPESAVATTPRRGLHGSRFESGTGSEPRVPLRYVLPAGALH